MKCLIVIRGLPRFPRTESIGKRLGCTSVCCKSTGYNFCESSKEYVSAFITMSQSKTKYHRVHVDEETDGTSSEKHTSYKLSIVNWSEAASLLVLVVALSIIFLIIVFASRSPPNKEGEHIKHCYDSCCLDIYFMISVAINSVLICKWWLKIIKCFAWHILRFRPFYRLFHRFIK